MSRIGKKIIPISEGVSVRKEGGVVIVRGPKGELSRVLPAGVVVSVEEKMVAVSLAHEGKRGFGVWGLARALIAGMVEGVANGFEKKLEFEGVGYRAHAEGEALVLQLGFSHPIRFGIPQGITIHVEKNSISVRGINKELVGTTAARIRALKPPEPYKGKGIRYVGEVIRRKAGKKAVASG